MHLKKYTPHGVAVLIFAIITIIHFNPLFKGKVISQSDIIQYKGMSKEVKDFREKEHAEPLWTNSMFGGMPAYQVSTTYPGNWMNGLDSVFHLFLPHPSGYIFMYFLGFFILLLCLGINPWLAFAGSLAYGFSSYFFIILEVGHNSKANAIGYLAPALGGLILLMQNKYRLGFAVSTLFMALELNANHVQISYYGFLVFALIFVTYFIKALREKNIKPFFTGLGIFLIASFIALLPNAGNLLSTYEYGQYTTRGRSELTIGPDLKPNKQNATSGLDKDYAVQYSYGIDETFTLLIPDFKGGISAPMYYLNQEALKKVNPEMREQVGQAQAYFGDQSITAGPVYIGAIVIFLAFLGLLIIDHPLKWPLFIATLLSVMLSWGKHFMGLSSLFMDYLPGYNKFRAVSMTLVIAEFTIPLLAVLALDKLIRIQESSQQVSLPFSTKSYSLKKIILLAAIVVGGFCLISLLMPTLVNTFTASNEEAEITQNFRQSGATDAQIAQLMPAFMDEVVTARQAIFKSDALRSLIFILFTLGVLLLYLAKKIRMNVFLIVLAVFISMDMWPVAYRYLNSRSFVPKAQYEAPQAKTPADARILSDNDPDYRVLNIAASPFQDATTSYYHKSIGGYHGAKLKKYDELISFHLFKEINTLSKGLYETQGSDSALIALTAKLGVLNMLNTKYFIVPTREEPVALKNPQANGSAWFVKEIKTVGSANDEIVDLGKINTKTQALVQQKNKLPAATAAYAGEGKINLQSYRPNDLIYASESNAKEFAVFSEIYYPKGWNAYLDGALAPYTCVDYLLRGMEVPAGKHKIEFKFEPAVYTTGNTIAMIGSLLVLLSVGAGFYFAQKKQEILL